MSEIANKPLTLNLNSAWKPIGYKSVKDAIISLTGSETKPEPSSLALDIEYDVDEFGAPIFDSVISMRPVSWKEWTDLPIRDWDLIINGANRRYRVPTVIVAVNYDKMPRKKFDGLPSNDGIFQRDGFTCQYTGQKLSKDELNVDHVIPLSRGGSNTWENMVTSRKDLNTKKGNKLNSEIGLNLIRKPVAPKPIDIMYLIKEARHKAHGHFIVSSN